ncbi:MAG TPA: biotin/lipoyl-binding protein [Candidatus Paceibacterota bacterium]|nr:biotin/lipoyl-binding protein [Candidatus Paceibacterota bacterium]
MKKTLFSILNKPLYVTIASLVVALGIGASVFLTGNAQAQAQLAKAGPGSISITGQATQSGTGTNLTLAFTAGGQINTVNVKTGDSVKKGDVLAALDPQNTAGGLTQAQGAYAAAVAAYQKVINGASGPAIDAARAALNTAKVARDQAAHQQQVLVDNAYTALLNATPQAYPQTGGVEQDAPAVSGSYTLGKEGSIIVDTYSSSADSGYSFRLSGLVTGVGTVSSITPQPLGNSGLTILFPAGYNGKRTWVIDLPNKNAPDYSAKQSAYQAALQTQTQSAATQDAAVAQAEATMNVTVAAARPEDVAAAQAAVESARGALQIAQAAYDQRRIIAPGDGTITAVHISAGQVAAANAPAIEMSGSSFVKDAAIIVPNAAIIHANAKTYVRVATPSGLVQREVTTGISDNLNTEILSGISAGDEVALQP